MAAAVLGERVASAGRVEKLGLFASLANVFSFNSQRTLGYASLVVVLAFGAILAVVKFRQSQVQPPTTTQQAIVTTPDSSAPKTAEVGSNQNQQVAVNDGGSVAPS